MPTAKNDLLFEWVRELERRLSRLEAEMGASDAAPGLEALAFDDPMEQLGTVMNWLGKVRPQAHGGPVSVSPQPGAAVAPGYPPAPPSCPEPPPTPLLPEST